VPADLDEEQRELAERLDRSLGPENVRDRDDGKRAGRRRWRARR
jgi:hypothetical protein